MCERERTHRSFVDTTRSARERERETERARERESKRAREQESERARERKRVSERKEERNPSSVFYGYDKLTATIYPVLVAKTQREGEREKEGDRESKRDTRASESERE